MTALRMSVVLLLAVVGGCPVAVWAQTGDSVDAGAETAEAPRPVVHRVQTALTEGDADRLLSASADRVEITLFGARTRYSSAQALYVMREFFRSHVPEEFFVRDVMETSTTCLVRGEYAQARVAQRLEIYVRLHQASPEDDWKLREVNIGVLPE